MEPRLVHNHLNLTAYEAVTRRRSLSQQDGPQQGMSFSFPYLGGEGQQCNKTRDKLQKVNLKNSTPGNSTSLVGNPSMREEIQTTTVGFVEAGSVEGRENLSL